MRQYQVYQVDAFTKTKFSGNPAGVVLNADGLSEAEMQQIARELNNSETAFILSSDNDDYDVHVRFFTPTREVPICGHATIAAHYVLAIENQLENTRIYQKTGAGILPVDIVKEGDDYQIIMTQGKIEFGDTLQGKTLTDLLNGLHLNADDLLEDYPVQIVSTGHSKVMLAIKNIKTLHALAPNMEQLKQVSEIINCNGFYVFTRDDHDSDALIHGRMFAPIAGINEDPVTGNANGPLGAYLVHHQQVKHDGALFSFAAIQGEAMKRPGKINVAVKISDNQPIEVQISGNAVVVYKTTLELN